MSKPIIIISAELSRFTKMENARRSADLVYDIITAIGDICYSVPCTGVYNGVEEQSYALYLPETTQENSPKIHSIVDTVLALAAKYKQESILVVNPKEEAIIMDTEGDGTVILEGTWTKLRYMPGFVPLRDHTEILGDYFVIE